MSLKEYRRKRNFARTPEPKAREIGEPKARKASEPKARFKSGRGPLRFVVHMHDATRLHFDLRLEIGGVFRSWAVPKGPTLDPTERRLAVYVEDHPLDYGNFEGTIPPGNYGAGTVLVWDRGELLARSIFGATVQTSARQLSARIVNAERAQSEKDLARGLSEGHLTFILTGSKLRGEFALVRSKNDSKQWLLIKKRDDQALSRRHGVLGDESVATGRTLAQISAGVPAPSTKKASTSAKKKSAKNLAKRQSNAAGKKTARKASAKTGAPRELDMTQFHPAVPRRAALENVRADWLYLPIPARGIRALCRVQNQTATFYSRTGRTLGPIAPSWDDVSTQSNKSSADRALDLVLDGEIAQGRYQVWDLLYAQGQDLRKMPLAQRAEALGSVAWPADFAWEPLTAAQLRRHASPVLARDPAGIYRAGVGEASAPDTWFRVGRLRNAGAQESRSRSPLKPAAAKPSPRGAELRGRASAPSTARATAPGEARFTHPDKIIFPREKITKGDLLAYYRAIAPVLLPQLQGRPVSLHRHPHGITAPGFFQKDVSGYRPRGLQTHRVYSESSARSIDYLVCNGMDALSYMVNLGCIEINPWLATAQDAQHPTFCVIDLDPFDTNTVAQLTTVARAVHAELQRVKVNAHVKTSGGRGLHIVVPLAPKTTFELSRDFALAICARVLAKFPQITSLERSPARRRGKIYLDCFQNRRGQTLASVYGVRPREGAPVSTPLKWSEVTARLRPQALGMAQALLRVRRLGDLWAPVLREQNDIARALRVLQASKKSK